MERDKTGRIITGSNRMNKDNDRLGLDRDDRSRDRVVILRDRDDWGGGGGGREDDQNQQGGQGGGGSGGAKYGNTYGLSQQFLESLGIDGALIPKVFISNVRLIIALNIVNS